MSLLVVALFNFFFILPMFQLSSSVTVIPLASATCANCEVAGARYIVSGYGTTVSTPSGSSQTSQTLKWVAQEYVDDSTCQAAARFTISASALCAGPIPGQSGTDSCQGDSGGPMVLDGSGGAGTGPFTQVGVVSTGTVVSGENLALCGSPGEFGIYVSVMDQRAWIDGILNNPTGGVTSGSGQVSSGTSIPWYYYVPPAIAGGVLVIILISCCCRACAQSNQRQQIANQGRYQPKAQPVAPRPGAAQPQMYTPQAAPTYQPTYQPTPASPAPSAPPPMYQPQMYTPGPPPAAAAPQYYPPGAATYGASSSEMPSAPPPPAQYGQYGNY